MKRFSRSPFVFVTGPKWRFCLTARFSIYLGRGWKGKHEFWDEGKLWAVLDDDILDIEEGYAWNGCSPAWCVFGRWIGTPTPAAAMIPSLVHDILWQFLDTKCRPWTQKEADAIFYDLMIEFGFPLKRTYFGTVSLFGSFYRRITKPNPFALCSTCNPTETKP